MTPERLRRIEEIFHGASALEGEAREAFISERCAGDPSLHREVVNLLDSAETGFLESAVPGKIRGRKADLDEGATVGRYRLIELIGEGGMGSVYLAERADGSFDQRVAVKVMRAAGPGLLRRFDREREVLARLEHPGIARLIDGGTTNDSRPYLVMEHVEGEPIDAYCGRNALSIFDRLRLMLSVCETIAYTHQNLIIHRDLKPRNILVDRDGRTRVIDFGIALPAYLGDAATMHTAADRVLGTLAYMSPEQCERGAGAVVDVRSDVYSVGVLLYELLSGSLPHDVSTCSLAGAVRKITEEPPARPAAIDPRLRGDIETIILKAMEKEPERRYQSAGELAEDIRRHLGERPIRARPASPVYLFRKFIRRHRSQIATGSVSAAAMVALATLGIAWFVVLPEWSRRSFEQARTHVLSWEAQESIYSGVCWRDVALGSSRSGRHYGQIASAIQQYERSDRFGMLDELGRGEFEAVRAAEALYYIDYADWMDSWPESIRDGIRHLATTSDLDAAAERAEVGDLRDAGILFMLTQRHAEAIRVFQRYETIVTNDPLVEALVGELYLALEKPALAYPRIRAAYEAFGGSRMITLSLAEAAVGVGDLSRAELLLNEAESLSNPDRSDRYTRVRAMFLAASGRFEEAKRAFMFATAVTTPDGFVFNMNPIACYHRAKFEARQGRTLSAAQLALLGLGTDVRGANFYAAPAVNLELFVRQLPVEIASWDSSTFRMMLEKTCLPTESYDHWRLAGSWKADPVYLPVSLQPWLLTYVRIREELLTRPRRIAVTPEDEARFEAERRAWAEPDELTELAALLDVGNTELWTALRAKECEGRVELIEAWVRGDKTEAEGVRAEVLSSGLYRE